MRKKNRQESYVLFSSKIQIQQFKECNIIYMDGTFKSAPKNYYQIYNILGRDNKMGEAIPLFHILMAKKSYELYYNIFHYIKTLFEINSIKKDFNHTYFMLDFEKARRKAFKDTFPNSNLTGCYVHYAKTLWAKAKN